MSLTLYDVAVPTYRQILGAQVGVLTKAEAHFKEKGIDEATIMAARLFEDMQPFPFQVVQVIQHSQGVLSLILEKPFTRPTDLTTLAAMRSAVTDAIEAVKAVDADALNAVAETELERTVFGREVKLVPQTFILTNSFPNFFFHATTAYDLLRQAGVPIGKRDFTVPPAAG
jgi:hypothetical protein